MPTYVYDKEHGCMVDKATGMPMLNQFERARPLQTPRVQADGEPYVSPVSGEVISGNKDRRDDLKKHGCIDARELRPERKKFKNRRFIEKRGLQSLAADGVYD